MQLNICKAKSVVKLSIKETTTKKFIKVASLQYSTNHSLVKSHNFNSFFFPCLADSVVKAIFSQSSKWCTAILKGEIDK